MKGVQMIEGLELPEFDPDKHHEVWHDMAGRPYRAGDLIAYASAAGDSVKMTIGMVRSINSKSSDGHIFEYRPYDHNTRTYLDPVPRAKIRVAPLKDSSRWRWTKRDVHIGTENVIRLDINLAEIEGELLNG